MTAGDNVGPQPQTPKPIWEWGEFGVYAHAYWLAAHHLIDAALADQSEIQLLVFPIGYLARHALELGLKDAAVWVERFLVGQVRIGRLEGSFARTRSAIDKELVGHNLHELLGRLEERLEVVPDAPMVPPSVRVAIEAVGMLDADAQRFRYPLQTRGRGKSFAPERFRTVDLKALREAVGPAVTFLIGQLPVSLVNYDEDRPLREAWQVERAMLDAEGRVYVSELGPDGGLYPWAEDGDYLSATNGSAEMLDDGDDD